MASVDTIRMAALLGICVVNLPFMGLPTEQAMFLPEAGPDRLAALTVAWMFQSRFFLLFSLLFGWGLQVQLASAARRGVAYGASYARRLAGLALMGVLHGLLVFTGDILLLYALLGALIWPLRQSSPRTLVRWALAMVPVAMLALLVVAPYLDQYADASLPEASLSGMPSLGGSYVEATRARWADWPGTFAMLVLFQGPMAFGCFALGLAAAKTGFFNAESTGRRRLARWAPWCLIVGLAANLAIALAPTDESLAAMLGLLALPVAAPVLSAAWLYLILWLDDHLRLPRVLVLAGRNSLTAYLLQGIIAGALFGAYGAGLFGKIGQAGLLPLSLGVALAAMLATGAIAQRQGRAPH
ncbi:MAG: hypothetical protein CSA54_00280, partial [Gammaproteobacteria bacterium]